MQKIISQSTILVLIFFAIACQNNKTNQTAENTATTAPVNANEEALNGDYCFQSAVNRDTTTVRFRVLSADDIRGEMIWNPWQRDGAVGTLTGKMISKNEMELLYAYVIEGANQTETKIMKVENNQLHIKAGELIDPNNDGNLKFKDATKAVYKETLSKINCDSQNISFSDNEDNSKNAIDWAGIYEGTLPCKDCDGIKTTITLNQNNTFMKTEVFLKKGKQSKQETKGLFEWNKTGDVVTLTANDKALKFKVGENNIVQLDANGQITKEKSTELYMLKKK
jgi:uncharacterized lipoprotein NlpE involved in copper resistance